METGGFVLLSVNNNNIEQITQFPLSTLSKLEIQNHSKGRTEISSRLDTRVEVKQAFKFMRKNKIAKDAE